MTETIKVAVAHSHVIMRHGIVRILDDLGCLVAFHCSNEKELFKLLATDQPDIIFYFVNTRTIDDFETIHNLTFHYPLISVIAFSMDDNETSVYRLIAKGISGYLQKDADIDELKRVVESIGRKTYHYRENEFGKLFKFIRREDLHRRLEKEVLLSEREIEFLKYLATELNYREIAAKMHVSHRTVEGYRKELSAKLKIKTRIGLVLYTIQSGIINPN